MKPRSIAVAAFGALALFAAACGLLDLGVHPPSAAERLGLRELRVLEHSRDGGAVMDVSGRRVLASCRRSRGHDLVRLSSGVTLVVTGVHVYEAPSERRVLSVVHRRTLVAVQADLAGSHALWIRELESRLELGDLSAHPVLFDGRRVEEVVLRARRPFLGLVVDPKTLRPLGAIYDSPSTDASSRILDSRLGLGPGC
ncbi:MAG TPA: hypothetical protein VLJ76_01145 [Gaiellaceae bacterium]|nr:hypothetical protein [Gaiellaceae bacterium]